MDSGKEDHDYNISDNKYNIMSLGKNDDAEENYVIIVEPINARHLAITVSVCCQTEETLDSTLDISDDCAYLFCNLDFRDGLCAAAVQTNIPFRKLNTHLNNSILDSLPKEIDCEYDLANEGLETCKGFHGLSSINSDESLISLTGVPFAIFTLIANLLPDEKTIKTDKREKLLLTLMKLKMGLSDPALGVLFKMHAASVKRIIQIYIQKLKDSLKNLVYWPAKHVVKTSLPKIFHRKYSSTRVMINCIEVNTEVPQRMTHMLTYSEYKQRSTVQFMVGCTPSGFVSFVSKCYRCTDENCDIVNLIEAGDTVLADREFPQIKTKIEKRNAKLLVPLSDNYTFAIEKGNELYNIALKFEQMNDRIMAFRIFSKFPTWLFPHIDDTVFIVCALLNLLNPIKVN